MHFLGSFLPSEKIRYISFNREFALRCFSSLCFDAQIDVSVTKKLFCDLFKTGFIYFYDWIVLNMEMGVPEKWRLNKKH